MSESEARKVKHLRQFFTRGTLNRGWAPGIAANVPEVVATLRREEWRRQRSGRAFHKASETFTEVAP
jgi:hypothetical protein